MLIIKSFFKKTFNYFGLLQNSTKVFVTTYSFGFITSEYITILVIF